MKIIQNKLIGDFNGDGFDDIVNLQNNGDNWIYRYQEVMADFTIIQWLEV